MIHRKADLRDTTFIIPIRVESEDRHKNACITIDYLCRHLDTNIIVLEHDVEPKMPAILRKYGKNARINYNFYQSAVNETFHRTKFLNIMLAQVTTPVVVNYDVDILLEKHVYAKCRDLIVGGHDLVYPYFWGKSQYQVYYTGRDKIEKARDISGLTPADYAVTFSEYGHCQFFKTQSYLDGGMENEGFISYAPEDQERGYRFKQLGYKVMWSTDWVYHLEHTRGVNSSSSNPMMSHNNQLLAMIKSKSEDELRKYYADIDYIKKYKSA
jgi:hypothetical protein